MPTQNTLIYYPAITDIVSADDLPEFLSFLKTGLETVLSKVYYKDYYFSKNISGKEYEKNKLNDAEMVLGNRTIEKTELSFQSYREGSSGANAGKVGGGCGCN